MWWLYRLEAWGIQLEARFLGISHASLCGGLCGKREMLEFLRKSAKWKACYGILFISTPLFGLPILSLLEEFHLMLFYLVGFQFVILERVWFWFWRYFVHAFINTSPHTMEYNLTLIRFCTLWEGPLILLFNFTIINIYFLSDKKKKNHQSSFIIKFSVWLFCCSC